MPRAIAAFAILCFMLAACASEAPAGDAEPEEEPAFDLALVQSNFQDECADDPIVVDELFCDQVDIDGMTADGTILNVPTGLNAAARDRARVICEMLARAHFDGATGDDLGYGAIGVLDVDGGNAAACTVQ